MRCQLRRMIWLVLLALPGASLTVACGAAVAAVEHDEALDDAAPQLPDEEPQESELTFASEEPAQLPDDPDAAEMPQETSGADDLAEAAAEGPAMDEGADSDDADAPAELSFATGDEQPQALDAAETEEVIETPPIDPATLAGVRPGETTREALRSRWGKPLSMQRVAGGVRETYKVGGFDRVRATIIEDVVDSVAVQLAGPISAKKLSRELGVEDVEPVEVWDDNGRLMGRAFPERGIMFGFNGAVERPQVLQIVLQPVDAEPFLARAQKRMSTRYADCLADLKQALKLAPTSARAHAIHSQMSLRAGELSAAIKSARKAIDLAPTESEYQLILAQAQAESGDYATAIERLRGIAERTKNNDLLRARAYLQWGDCLAASPKQDLAEAMKLHARAIKLVEPLASKGKHADRRVARETLIDAHLAVARDIGAGRWQQKAEVIPKWLDRAMAMADEMVAHDRAEPQVSLRVYQQALAALAPVADPPDASEWIRGATQLGATLMEQATDPGYKATLSWQLAIALGDAVEIESARKRRGEAIELGNLAMECFEAGAVAAEQVPERDYLRGRLMFRMGELAVTDKSQHQQAIAWFERAMPLLERAPASVAAMRGRRGEMMVAMAISYWETNNPEQALRLTERGARLMEQAAGDGLVTRAALATPYANLANMHKKLGHGGDAKKYSVMAASYQEKVESK